MEKQTKIIIGISSVVLAGALVWRFSKKNGQSNSFEKKCNNLQGMTVVKNCVANNISNYLGSSLSAPGSCATVKVDVGLLSTTITGGGCK